MDFQVELDEFAANGRITNVMLVRTGDRWQTYIKLGHTNGYAAQSAGTPSESLAKTLAILPACEDYDLKHGHVCGDRPALPVSPVAKTPTSSPAPKAADVDDLLG